MSDDDVMNKTEDEAIGITEEEAENLPIVNYQIGQVPHLFVGPCPECDANLEMSGSMQGETDNDPWIVKAIAGQRFRMLCRCGQILQLESPRILLS